VKFVKGDVTQPSSGSTRIIAHLCNNARIWKDPVSLAISARWPEPEESFFKQSSLLGTIKVVSVDQDTMVANLFGQEGPDPGELPLEAVEYCFKTLAHFARMYEASVHLSRSPGILAREWDKVEAFVVTAFEGIDLNVYDA